MFLIVGLGNPGAEYDNTRHNLGFKVLDRWSHAYKLNFQKKTKFKAQLALASGESTLRDIILCKPETYMNLSGQAVAAVASYYKITLDKIAVIHDDIDLKVGEIRYKCAGGAGGHNGLRSIDQHIGQNYHRIRIGIGRPQESGYGVSDFVLGKFSAQENLVSLNSIDLLTKKISLLRDGRVEDFKHELKLTKDVQS